jgi:(2Fe-2S) ferredoxin
LSKLKKISTHVLICEHKTCFKEGGKESAKELKSVLKEEGLRERVLVTKVDCLDQCERGPIVVVYPDGIWYGRVDEECARRIVREHIEDGHPVEENILHDMYNGKIK